MDLSKASPKEVELLSSVFNAAEALHNALMAAERHYELQREPAKFFELQDYLVTRWGIDIVTLEYD